MDFLCHDENSHILEGNTLLVRTFREDPSKVYYLSDRPEVIRMLWFFNLFPLSDQDKPSLINDFPIYCSLLRHQLIPPDQMSEAHTKIVERAGACTPEKMDLHILKESGFFEIFRERVILGGQLKQYKWSSQSGPLMISYLRCVKLDLEVVHYIMKLFSGSNYPLVLGDYVDF